MASKRTLKRSNGGNENSNKNLKKKRADSVELLSIDEIKTLGTEIQSSSKYYNNFTILLEQYQTIRRRLGQAFDEEAEKTGRQVSVTLYGCFEELIKKSTLKNNKNYDEEKRLVIQWLQSKYEAFKTIIGELIIEKFSFETSLQIDLLEIGLNLIRLESRYMKPGENDLYFPNHTYKNLIDSLLLSENGQILADGSSDNFLVHEFTGKFTKYWDLQFYFVQEMSETLEEWRHTKNTQELQSIFANFYAIMRNKLLAMVDGEELEQQKVWIKSKLPSAAYKMAQFQAKYQKCFVTVLSYPLLTSQYKSILLVLHKRIIPHMAQPQSLMDFLTDAYDITDDEVIPILALNSLYELMKRYNLEYPDFYRKLYSLLTPSLLYTRYRSRFFRLCDLFLSSTHLAANLVASFIKRLARLALALSASGVVIIIPFIYNLLKRHPSCMVMIHNKDGAAIQDYEDPFDNLEPDPLKTGAMASSLWELETLMSHYHPNIATLAKIYQEPFKKPSYNMEDFLDWSYVSLLESERNRRYKTKVALEFEQWDSLVESCNDHEKTGSSVYLEGWSL